MGRTKARQTSQDSARDAVDAAARRAHDFHLAFNGCEDAYIHHALVTAALSPRDFVLCLGTSHLFTEAVLTEAHIVKNLIVFAPFKPASLLAGTSRVHGSAFMEQVLYALRHFMVLLALPGQQTRGAWQRRPRAGGEDRSGDAITAEAPRNHACDRGQRRRRQHLLAQNPPARTNDQLLDARKVGRRPSTLGAVASATAGCAGRRAFRGAPAGAAPHHRPALERAALGGPVVDDEPLRVWRPAPRPGQLSHPPSAPGGLQHVYIPHQVRRFQGRQGAAGLGLHLHKQGVRRLHRARFRRDLLAV
mmetsp:Transcript_19719/g.63542  ORF Transcript_19719/g.63542 Transcript_19719/m.63542 type:complete len:304 (-) Transcript_19719:208-1119(-)